MEKTKVRCNDNDNRKEAVVRQQQPTTYEEELTQNFERLTGSRQ